jgi:hypothetical protein
MKLFDSFSWKFKYGDKNKLETEDPKHTAFFLIYWM